ncbi:Elongator complex protein 5 [Mycotypha africana]|uniref:Elongator complex protein 5 n=1 Tax=Mycotypha africana TaxID=64632 RepID=UPI002300CBFF|nr:Elongator complex protein 5 [Mycotypha africana]KAI8992174.1 Elongator complex protein 5 [Mycotypha africana]
MNNLTLAQLLDNKKTCSFLCFNDTVRLSSLPFLVDIGKRSLIDERNVIVVLTETSPKAWRSYFSKDKLHNMFVIDCFSDPQGWDEDTTAQDPHTVIVKNLNLQQMEKLILQPIIEIVNTSASCTILVDSVVSLAMISQHKTYQLIKTLDSLTTADTVRLVLGLHADMNFTSPNHNGLALKDSINRMATAVVSLEALRERTHFDTTAALTGFKPVDTFSYLKLTSNNVSKGGIARIEWKKRSGKVVFETNGFIMNDKTGLLEVVSLSRLQHDDELEDDGDKEEELSAETMEAEALNKLSQNVSFKLTLTEKQKEVKDSLVLPYYKAQNAHDDELEVENESKNNSALIYYDPDAADDFDDEDPDDDLDI